MKWLFVAALLVGCLGSDDTGDDGTTSQNLDPAACPAEPFEHCVVHDGGWDVWCDNGAVYANDMTAHSYCYPGTHDIACTIGGKSISQQHMCASSTCATTEKRYFDYVGDYMAFDKSSLCAP